jgi:dipeptidyl aminopeptidase/acylaminoacyl peptidase
MMFYRAFFAGLLLVCSAGPAGAQTPSIEDFTGKVDVSSVTLSPDGSAIASLRHRPDRDELIVLDRANNQATILLSAFDQVNEELNWVAWKDDNRLLIGVTAMVIIHARAATGSRARQDFEETIPVQRVVALNRDGSNRVVLFEGQQRRMASLLASTRLVDTLLSDPENVLVSTYGNTGYALFRVNVNNGNAREVASGSWDTFEWVTDSTGAPVLRFDRLSGNQGYRAFRRSGNRWEQAFEERGGRVVNLPSVALFGAAPEPGMIWVATRGASEERAVLRRYNTADGTMGAPVYENARADASYAIVDPNTRQLLAGCANVERIECQYFDSTIGRHLRAVSSFFDNAAEIQLASVSTDGNTWLLYVEGPTIAPGYYLYDRTATRVDHVAGQTVLTEAQLSPMRTFTYRSRDGVDLWGYLTVPRSAPQTGAPMVVLPHGGPEARDYYGYDTLVQFLASRGYVVFQPQFRGSGGFGRAFQESGRRQWGQRMQDDVTDGVRALIEAGAVDANRICIVGHSYGGYAALAGATYTPELYRCAVSISGVSDLPRSLRTERTDGGLSSASYEYWTLSMGSPSADREMLERFSPSRNAAQIQVPVLLMHGEADETVPIIQSEIMDRALRDAGKNVRFVRIEESDHYYTSWEPARQHTLYNELGRFLAEHLPPR